MLKKLTKKDLEELQKSISNPPKEVIDSYQEMLRKLDEGLPRAGGEVMHSRIKW